MTPTKSKDTHTLFLNTHPALNNSSPMLSPDEQQEQIEQIEQAFEDEAELRGVALWELMLQLTATSEEQLQSQLNAAHQEIAEMVEMSWEDYCRLHNLSDGAP